jgi:CRISPR-associated endonuclease Cas1
MPSLFLTTPGTRISLTSERLHLEFPATGEHDAPAPPPRDIPLHDIEQIVADERINLTTPALCECLRRAIPVVLLAHNQSVIGLCQAPAGSALVRVIQHRRAAEPGLALALAATLVEAKIQNSRRVLQRIASNRTGYDLDRPLTELEHLRRSCLDASSVAALRGYEGAAAARYFETYALFFPPDCPFPGRSRRPPLDPPNALLSFAYTLLATESQALVHTAGLDPAVGYLHEPDDGRPSLALDLIEPFRAPVADALALDLMGHGIVKPGEHFERRDGGCFLNLDGRRRFFTAYERRLEREFTSEQHGIRTSLRGELRRQVQNLKRTLTTNDVFEPFLMN